MNHQVLRKVIQLKIDELEALMKRLDKWRVKGEEIGRLEAYKDVLELIDSHTRVGAKIIGEVEEA